MSVRLYVRMEQLDPPLGNFHEIWYIRFFRKSIEKIEISVKSDMINSYSTWRPIYIFDRISLSSS